MQDEIRPIELLLRTATTLGAVGTLRWNPHGGEIALSTRARAILGVDGQEASSFDAVVAALHPDERSRAQALVERLRRAPEEVAPGEWRLSDDGGQRWMAMMLTPSSSDGETAEMVGAVLDVTERRAWRRERELYQRALSGVGDGEGPNALAEPPMRPPHDGSPLSARETEVLQLASHGGSSAAIAERLQVSPSTVKTHFEHIYAKLGVIDRAGAVAEALRRGLIV